MTLTLLVSIQALEFLAEYINLFHHFKSMHFQKRPLLEMIVLAINASVTACIDKSNGALNFKHNFETNAAPRTITIFICCILEHTLSFFADSTSCNPNHSNCMK